MVLGIPDGKENCALGSMLWLLTSCIVLQLFTLENIVWNDVLKTERIKSYFYKPEKMRC